MNIRERRFAKIMNKLLREELQKGNLPSSKEFIWKLNQYLLDHDIGEPSLNFTAVRKQTTARAADYNQIMHAVYDDLENLYMSVISQHNYALKNFNKFEVEKSKLDYELNVLENRLKELILLYGRDGFLSSVYDMFNDFSNVDTAKTIAHVDIKQHEVMIGSEKNSSRKVYPTAVASFDVLPEISTLVDRKTVSGSPADALSDQVNNTWQELITTKTKMDVGGYYYINFVSPQSINRIALSLHSIKPTFIKIEFTPDNINWVPLPYYEEGVKIESHFAFDFPGIAVRKIRILMAKGEPDGETVMKNTHVSQVTESRLPQISSLISKPQADTASRRMKIYKDDAVQVTQGIASTDEMRYTYLFGIQNISFFTASYSNQAEIYSTPLTVASSGNFTIDKVSLLVNEELPNGTDIRYYIAIPPEGTGTPDWKDLSPVNRDNPKFDQMINFKNISTSVPSIFSIDPKISIGEYEQESLYTNGIRFYKIGEISGRSLISGTEQLYVGHNTWGKQSYVFRQTDIGHQPNIADWNKPSTAVTRDFVKIQDGKPGLLLNKATSSVETNHMFTLGVFSKKEKQLVRATPASTDPIAIYMNGQLLFQGIPDASTRVNYLFESGWNELIVTVYTSKSVNMVNGATVDLNFDPRQYGSSVYSSAKPMIKVSLFDLRYNVLSNDYTKYAVNKVNDKSQVILNHAVPGLDYEFYYNYVDGTVKDTILFKAELTRDDSITGASPKLRNYRLRFS